MFKEKNMENDGKDFLIENLLLGAASIDLMPTEDIDKKSKQEVIRAKERAKLEKIEEFSALQKNFIERMIGKFIAFTCSMTALMTAVYMANNGEPTWRILITIIMGFTPLVGAKLWLYFAHKDGSPLS